MPIIATNNGGGGDFAKAPEGTHVARCYRVIQLGTITKNILGQDKRIHEVRIDWELPNELHVFSEENGEEPFTIGTTYTLSLAENAKLRKMLESWRGKKFTDEELKGFDVSKLIGATCLVNVGHNESKAGKIYADVMSVMPVVKGTEVPGPILQPLLLEFDTFDWNAYESLSQHWQDRIANSEEYGALLSAKQASEKASAQRTHGQASTTEVVGDGSDDLPF